MQVGGVEVDVGEAGVPERAGPERTDRLIQAGADPRHLGLGDARVHSKRGDQVVHRASRDPVDVGLHHHRIQRLVDPAPRLKDDREERSLAQLRDPQLDIAGLGGQQPVSGAVALGGPGIGAFVATGADVLGRLGFDQLLHDHPHRLADQIDPFAGAECVEELGHDRRRTWPSVGSLR